MGEVVYMNQIPLGSIQYPIISKSI